MTAAERILELLQGVKQTGPSRWVAKCPAHEDHSPSLSLRESTTGSLLLYDFGGCETSAVLAALGLGLRDLYDRPLKHCSPPSRSRVPAADLLQLAGLEIDLAGIILSDAVEGRSISEIGWQRLAHAVARIGQVRNELHGR